MSSVLPFIRPFNTAHVQSTADLNPNMYHFFRTAWNADAV